MLWDRRAIAALRFVVRNAAHHQPASGQTVGILCALLSVLLFSSFTLASRLGPSSSLTLPDLAALRFRGGIALALLTAAVPAVTTQAAMPFLAEFLNRIGEIGVAAVTLGMLVARQTSRQSCNDAGKTRRSKVMLLGPDVPS